MTFLFYFILRVFCNHLRIGVKQTLWIRTIIFIRGQVLTLLQVRMPEAKAQRTCME